MGLDAVILFRADPDFRVDQIDSYLPTGFEIRAVPDYIASEYPEATHEVDQGFRYYSPGYERGPWPLIASVLMSLLATPGVRQVWYGSDCNRADPITPDRVVEITEYYMLNGRRPYFNGAKPIFPEKGRQA